jgi:hypothetical protein
MAERSDICETTTETPAEAATTGPTSGPAAAAPVLTEGPKPEGTSAESVKSELKLPPVAQLDMPAPVASPLAAEPPPVLREHENRAPLARPAAQAKNAPAKAAASQAKEKPKSRFPLLAVTLAIAAGLGGAAGALGVPAILHLTFGPATAAAPAHDAFAELHGIKGLAAHLATELGALRTAAEQSTKATATQFGKLSERLERAERAQAEPAAKIAKIIEAVERLERRVAAPQAHADVTGSVNAQPYGGEPKPKPAIIEDYVVRKVFDGMALVEGRRGIIEVEPGSTLPGAGRVEEIRRQDGRWVVVTNKGLIVQAR